MWPFLYTYIYFCPDKRTFYLQEFKWNYTCSNFWCLSVMGAQAWAFPRVYTEDCCGRMAAAHPFFAEKQRYFICMLLWAAVVPLSSSIALMTADEILFSVSYHSMYSISHCYIIAFFSQNVTCYVHKTASWSEAPGYGVLLSVVVLGSWWLRERTVAMQSLSVKECSIVLNLLWPHSF